MLNRKKKTEYNTMYKKYKTHSGQRLISKLNDPSIELMMAISLGTEGTSSVTEK